MGNHDWYEDYIGISNTLASVGINMIDDSSVEIRKQGQYTFFLAGISDYYSGGHDVKRALQKIPEDRQALCITHTPDVFPELPATCLLTLVDHTHGGQVNLPLVGRLIIPSHYGTRYATGLIEEKDHYLFVATGIGTSIIPVHFSVPPEISILHIH